METFLSETCSSSRWFFLSIFLSLRLTSGITGLRQMGLTTHGYLMILAGDAIDHNPLLCVLAPLTT